MIGILKCPCGGVQTKRMHATVSQYARAHFKDEGNYRHVFFYKKIKFDHHICFALCGLVFGACRYGCRVE